MTKSGGLGPSQTLRARFSRALAVVAAVGVFTGLTGGVLAPTSAQAATLPRYLPTQIPEGFSVALAEDSRPRGLEGFLGVVRNANNTQEFMITGTPANAEDGRSFADLAKRQSSKIKVHGKPAVLVKADDEITLRWYEKNAFISIASYGVSSKATISFAAGVIPSKKQDGSFAIKKVPANFSKIFVGEQASLISDTYLVYYGAKGGELMVFGAANVAPNYIEVFGGPSSGLQPTTLNNKPAFVTSKGFSGVVWMEQTNLLLQVISLDLNVESMMGIAASVAPLDEAAYQAAVTVPEGTNPLTGESDPSAKPVEESGPVAAGNVAGSPWVATIAGQCVNFAIGKTKTEACVTGFLSPSALIGSVTTVNNKPVVVGVTGANVATVVITANGAELARLTTQPVLDQPGLRYFISELANGEGVTAVGLDASGKEIAPSTPLKKV